MTDQGFGVVVRPLPGNGLVAHLGGLLLVCDSGDSAAPELVQALRETAATGGDGRALARRAAQILARSMTGDPATCAVAGPAGGGGVALLVSGRAAAVVRTGDGEQRLTGDDALTWTDRLVKGPVRQVELTLPGAGQGDPLLRLDGGVVRGGGVALTVGERQPVPPPARPLPAELPATGLHNVEEELFGPRQEQPPSDRPVAPLAPYPLHEPSHAGPQPHEAPPRGEQGQRLPPVYPESPHFEQGPPFEPAPTAFDHQPPLDRAVLEGRQEQAEGAILVYGVDCKNDHFNDPRLPYCAACGAALAQRTLVPYQGPRPPLGLFVLDDGTALSLEGDYLFGRDPDRAPEVTGGAARPAKVTSPDGSVSRRHLRVALDGWDVNLVDLGSVNGTQIQPPGDPNFYDIPPNEPVTIAPGTIVRIGVSRTMRFETRRP